MPLPYKLRHPDTCPPRRMTDGSAGYDLTVDEDVIIPSGATRLVTTGVALAIPWGKVGKVYIRSSFGAKRGIVLANQVGIIDNDFRDYIGLALRNISDQRVTIPRGTRTAQILIQSFDTPALVQVDELPVTERGTGGFGSTGQ